MPGVSQQAEAAGDATQCDRDEPGADENKRERRDVNTEQVDLGEAHAGALESKYDPCSASTSEMAMIRPRTRSASSVSGPVSGSEARRRSIRCSRAIATALFPSTKDASAASNSVATPRCETRRR